jgi:hypothetical protein
MVSEFCNKKQQITMNSTWIYLFDTPSCTTQPTTFQVTDFGLHPGHYQTYTLHRTYEINHTVVHTLTQESELIPLTQIS